MQAVLIVDRDLGFTFWLGQALNAGGYFALPAKDVTSALELMEELGVTAGLLIVSRRESVSPLLKRLLATTPSFKMIALEDGAHDAGGLSLAATSAGPPWSDAFKAHWLATVASALTGEHPASALAGAASFHSS